MADKKDPTVTSTPAKESEGSHPAVPIEKGADYAGDKKYKDNPDKPGPDSVAQVEVT